jgi:prophage regulatory protein
MAEIVGMNQLATAKEVCALLRIGRTTLWRWVKEGSFPRPLTVGAHCTRWRQAEIEEWLISAKPQLRTSAGFGKTRRNNLKHKNEEFD